MNLIPSDYQKTKDPKNFLEWLKIEFGQELRHGWQEIEEAFSYYQGLQTTMIPRPEGFHCHCVVAEMHSHIEKEWIDSEVCTCYDSKN